MSGFDFVKKNIKSVDMYNKLCDEYAQLPKNQVNYILVL